MCFSATASFGVAAALTVVGAMTTYHTKGKSTFIHATIPLLFALQQAIEGGVWLTLSNPNLVHLHYSLGYLFIFFAFIVWPIMIPASLVPVERSRKRRSILIGLSMLGIFLAVSLTIVISLYPLEIGTDSGHLMYSMGFSKPIIVKIYLMLYAIATILPFLIVKSIHERFFGLTMLATLILAFAYTFPSFISTWCYFAALVSLMILLVIYKRP